MKNEVIVVKPQNYSKGQPHPQYPIITVKKDNSEFGSIMLEQTKFVLSPGRNIGNVQRRTAHLAARVEDLIKMVEAFNLKEGVNFNRAAFPVDLVIEERTKPFYEGQPPKINPSTTEVITHNGEDVYRYTWVVPEGEERRDDFLKSDTEEETASGEKLQPKTEFQKAE